MGGPATTYQDRALRLRRAAETAKFPALRAALLHIADQFDRLAALPPSRQARKRGSG
jgi:hypothetical protein